MAFVIRGIVEHIPLPFVAVIESEGVKVGREPRRGREVFRILGSVRKSNHSTSVTLYFSERYGVFAIRVPAFC